jgi:hypothetical protein
MNRLKRLLGAQDGWGPAAGVLLLLGFGLFVLFVSVADLREAARLGPEERGCESWLADPSGPRWVALTGCRLDLSEAASRKWKGWLSLRDGGTSGERFLELFIPIVLGAEQGPSRAVLATSDPALLKVVDAIAALPPDEVHAYLADHAPEVAALLEPKRLVGYVEPVKSVASRSALGMMTAQGAVVLEHGRAPPRGNALFGLVVGLSCVAFASRSVTRRYLLERESAL